MDSLHQLVARSETHGMSGVTIGLLITLLVLALISVASVVLLFYLRRRRNANKNAGLPFYKDEKLTPSKQSHHRRISGISISSRRGSKPAFVYEEKMTLAKESYTIPSNELPAIHITFPDEVDTEGKHQSGRVVVVHIGEKGELGMEPAAEESLPQYQRFQSIDIERIGGLQEKASRPPLN